MKAFRYRTCRGQFRSQPPNTVDAAVHAGFKGAGCIELVGSDNSETHTIVEVSKTLTEIRSKRIFEQLNPDYVLYDTSADSSCSVLHAITSQAEITRLFVVTTADLKALQTANDAFAFLEQYNGESSAPIQMGGLIFNNITSSFEETFVNDFAYHANARAIGKVPHSQVVRQCELYGKTVIEYRPQSNHSYYYRRLANQIVDAAGAIYSGNFPQPMSSERLRAWSLEWAERIYALENGLVTDGAAI